MNSILCHMNGDRSLYRCSRGFDGTSGAALCGSVFQFMPSVQALCIKMFCSLAVVRLEAGRPRLWHPLTHWSQTQFLEGHSSAQFSSNPNQTHLIQLIEVFRITRNFQAGVSWIWLELNCAELWPSRNWVWDHCSNASLFQLQCHSACLPKQESASGRSSIRERERMVKHVCLVA